MDNSGLRERVANELKIFLAGGKTTECIDRILALIDAEYRPLLDAAEATLAVLECGVDPGPHHMDSLEGRAAWIDRMKPVRERLRAEVRERERAAWVEGWKANYMERPDSKSGDAWKWAEAEALRRYKEA